MDIKNINNYYFYSIHCDDIGSKQVPVITPEITAKKRKKKKRKRQDPIKDWANIRNNILKRDNYRCRICGSDSVEAQLNVHHIDINRNHNEPINLVTLCRSCHRQVHNEGYRPELYEDWPIPWGPHPLEF